MRKGIAEQPRHAQRHIDARPVEAHQRHHLEPRHPFGTMIPDRLDPDQVQRHGELLARGAHRRRTPEIDDQRAEVIALLLHMPPDQFLGELDPLRLRGAARHRAGVDGIEVTSGRQHIGTAPVRRAGRPRRHAPAVQPRQQPGAFRRPLLTPTEDVEPFAELAVLHIADERVDPSERVVCPRQPSVSPRPTLSASSAMLVRSLSRRAGSSPSHWHIRRATPPAAPALRPSRPAPVPGGYGRS
ncbi:Uncharacterised protein [Sphingomonas paucimobilis]|nr:Uncharacterised protein [Sphingomonas paucimobilis]